MLLASRRGRTWWLCHRGRAKLCRTEGALGCRKCLSARIPARSTGFPAHVSQRSIPCPGCGGLAAAAQIYWARRSLCSVPALQCAQQRRKISGLERRGGDLRRRASSTASSIRRRMCASSARTSRICRSRIGTTDTVKRGRATTAGLKELGGESRQTSW